MRPDLRLVIAAAGPVLYGSLAVLVLWLYSPGDDHNEIVHDIAKWFGLAKVPAVIGLVVLSVWAGRALARGGRLWLLAAGLWTVVGVAAVALYGWPTWSDPQHVFAREIVFLTIIAWSAAALARFGSRVQEWLPSAAIPIAVMAIGTLYLFLNPWAFVYDYDIFIGDAVLGATMGDLYFFYLPVDLVSAMALGVAGLTLVVVVVSERLMGRHPVDERLAVSQDRRPVMLGSDPLSSGR